MQHLKLYQKGKIVFLFFAVTAILTAACGRLAYLMIVQSDYYGKKAQALLQKFLNKWTIFLFCSILFSSNQKEH